MGERIERKFNECIKEGKVKKFAGAKRLTGKELKVAASDLAVAREGLNKNQWKWSTIQAYYSMFHTARALLFSAGYREKSHFCLRVAIEALFVSSGKISEKFVDAFQTAKTMRENADYEENFSQSGARKLVSLAEEFLLAAEQLLTA